ncbi:MAG: VWA domain-containing protein [Gaiellaceae bacterium MAG52_C11]|nr:VWA domain-containing protein [Candidatus Gaiellasilicea maunaloa]
MSAVERVVAFGGALRAAGLPVGTDRLLAFREAAELVPGGELYWAGRATLVGRRDELPVYDRVYHEFFGGSRRSVPPSLERTVRLQLAGAAASGEGSVEVAGAPEVGLASSTELLRHKSFSRCTPEELAELARLLARLQLEAPLRRTPRRGPARPGDLDLRRTLRRALRTGGETVEPAWRDRRRRRRRLVLLLDISGSMSEYSRALVVFAHAALRNDRRFEAFSFGTRLTRLTRPLAGARPDEALRRAAAQTADWDGGTRIGASLKTFLDEFGHPGTARGAVVVICSDGLEVDEPKLLTAQMARLHRLAHRVVWLNPLKENPEYAPLARGMKAALPHVDLFASGHNLASLEEIATTISMLRR